MKINNQNIYGGNQQFADNIYNNVPLSEVDRKFVELLSGENEGSPDQSVVEANVKQLKAMDSTKEEKHKSKGFIKTIFDTTLSEVTRGAVRALIENGPDYLNFL